MLFPSQKSMNVLGVMTTVMSTPSVQIPKAALRAPAEMATLEMVDLAQVGVLIKIEKLYSNYCAESYTDDPHKRHSIVSNTAILLMTI